MISIIVEQTIKAINELLLLSSQHKVVDLQSELNALTLTIISSSAFGKGFETIANAKQIVCLAFTEVLEAIEYRTIRMINHIPLISQLPYWRKNILDKGSREISVFVDQIIADRRHEKSTSLCSGEDLLLSAIDTQ
ncbi:unnamed protein product [Rotaria sp. Silwood2]|nr:unnamed protein product [Rotaria sp. Silwood2]